jgi:transposase
MDTVVKKSNRTGWPNHPRSFRLKIAVAACAPVISVSKLGLNYQPNAKMVLKWRRQYLAGEFAGDDSEAGAMLPVVVMASKNKPQTLAAMPGPRPVTQRQHVGIAIEIEIGGAVMRFDGAVDAETLRLIIASLQT